MRGFSLSYYVAPPLGPRKLFGEEEATSTTTQAQQLYNPLDPLQILRQLRVHSMNPLDGRNLPGTLPSSRAPTPTMPMTRSTHNSSQPSPLTKEEIVSQDFKVKDKNSGIQFLSKNSLCVVGEPFTTKHLTTTLLHIMQIPAIPRQVIKAIRAVAFLLEKETSSRIAEAVTSQISTMLPKQIAHLVIAAIAPQMATFLETNESLTTNVESLTTIHTTASNTSTGITAVKNIVKHLIPSLTATQDGIKTLLTDLATKPQANEPPQRTYSNAVKSPTSLPLHTASLALSRAATKERQILIDPHRGHILHSLNQPISTIADKFKDILDVIKDDEAPALDIKAIT
ncbi:hypothetical protein OG21DRAFT_1491952 [Imleria badia]|nr:hypothetical protein OG21DRAFT_1491952 [Imleria badia]